MIDHLRHDGNIYDIDPRGMAFCNIESAFREGQTQGKKEPVQLTVAKLKGVNENLSGF